MKKNNLKKSPRRKHVNRLDLSLVRSGLRAGIRALARLEDRA